MAELSEDLTLNIGPALAEADQLASALVAAVQSAGPALAESLTSALASVDLAGLSSSLTQAVQGADTSLALAPDTAPLESAIAAAVASADTTVTVEADASGVSGEIDAAVASADTTVPLTADGTEVTTEGDQAVKDIDGTVPLIADTADFVAQANAAAQDVFESQVSNAAKGIGDTQGIIARGAEVAAAAEGVDALSTATKGLSATNAGLQGSLGGVASSLGVVGGALVATVGATGVFFTNAVQDAEAADRMRFVFGELATSVQNVNLPANNFNLTFQQIARVTGTADEAVQQAAAHIGQLGTSAGATSGQVVDTTHQILALATFLRTTNPSLGDTAQIADGLTAALARGGRALVPYGIALTAAEINARALRDTGKGTAAELNNFEKAAAAAAIETERLGPALGQSVAEGAHSAALALPQLKEQLREVIDAVGAPLIGPVTQLFGALEPTLAGLATSIGRLLLAGAPLAGFLEILLKLLGDLIGIVNAIPLPVLTAAVTAFGASLVAVKLAEFLAGLFTLGANALVASGEVGILGAAVNAFTAEVTAASFGAGTLSTGILAGVGAFVAASAALNALPHETADAAAAQALAVAGLTSNQQLATQSTRQLVDEQGKVSEQIHEVQSRLKDLSTAEFVIGRFTGSTRDLQTQLKALTAESKSINDALQANTKSAEATGGAFSQAGKDAAAFGDELSTAVRKADAVGTALASVAAANASLVSQATGTLKVSSAFTDTASAIDTAAKAADKAATSSGNASSALVTQATHAKDLRDAETQLRDAEEALATLRAGPSAEDRAKAELAVAQAISTTQAAEQRVLDTEQALAALRAPSADTKAKAEEDVSKAVLNEQKATLALSDAKAAQAKLDADSTATDRQKIDAGIALQEAQFGVTDATRAREQAEAALKKLTEDSLAGSKAITAAEAAHTDAVNSLAAAQLAQQDAQAKQTKLFTDAQAGSEAEAAALQKVADAQDRLTSVIESGSAKQASAAVSAAKTHVDALSSISKGLDDQIAQEDKFFADLEKIQAEGGTQIVAQLLALGPVQGAAEASAVATATQSVVTALETKTETLKAKEDQHAQDIATIFGASLNDNLIKAFATQLANETKFFTNVQAIFDAGDTVLANKLLAQGPVQGAALAQAIANATPQVRTALETQAENLATAEKNNFGIHGQIVGSSFGAGIAAGATSPDTQAKIQAAATSLGDALKNFTTTAILAHSPSRVAMELGGNWVEGLVLGLTDGRPLVENAAASLASAMVVTPNPASPSGLAVEIGEKSWAGGLAAGVLRGIPLVASAAAQLSAALVVTPTVPTLAVQTASTAGSTAVGIGAGQTVTGSPGIVNNFNLPAGITDPQALALAVSARQAQAAMR
jgi:hypothetical protein